MVALTLVTGNSQFEQCVRLHLAHERGIYAEGQLLDKFFEILDPDEVRRYLETVPDVAPTVEAISKDAPRTEEEWVQIAADWQADDRLFRESGGRWKTDPDGYWVWDKPPFRCELNRVTVQCLLEHFDLDTFDEPWNEWLRRREDSLRLCEFDPWILESRLHWNWFLQTSGLPFVSRFPDNPFGNNPAQTENGYHYRAGLGTKTTDQLEAIFGLVESNHPLYWFKVKRKLRSTIVSRRNQ